MKISGIICEYNPLHNGHLYHIEQVKRNGADAIVAVMSGNFMQRGDVAVMDKFTRARLAVEAGVDLVIELPVSYAVAPAEVFASGSVALLSALPDVTELSFGSECGDIELLQKAAEACRMCKTEYRDVVEDLLRQGHSYPDVLMSMVNRMYGAEVADVLLEPNNTLAVEYLSAVQNQQSQLVPFTVQRRGAGHHSLIAPPVVEEGTAGIASATYIRSCLHTKRDCSYMLPSYCMNALEQTRQNGKIADMKYLERVLLYHLRTARREDIAQIAEVGQGLEYRILQSKNATSMEEVLANLQTKRYPLSRLRRILLHILLDIRRTDMQGLPPYGRILAFNDMGRQILRLSKGRRTLPFSHALKDLAKLNARANRCAKLDSRATDIYQLAMEHMGVAGQDYRRKMEMTRRQEQTVG